MVDAPLGKENEGAGTSLGLYTYLLYLFYLKLKMLKIQRDQYILLYLNLMSDLV